MREDGKAVAAPQGCPFAGDLHQPAAPQACKLRLMQCWPSLAHHPAHLEATRLALDRRPRAAAATTAALAALAAALAAAAAAARGAGRARGALGAGLSGRLLHIAVLAVLAHRDAAAAQVGAVERVDGGDGLGVGDVRGGGVRVKARVLRMQSCLGASSVVVCCRSRLRSSPCTVQGGPPRLASQTPRCPIPWNALGSTNAGVRGQIADSLAL
jgi:hypothetical protein